MRRNPRTSHIHKQQSICICAFLGTTTLSNSCLLSFYFYYFFLNSIHTLSAVIIIGLDRLKCWANLTFCWLTVIWNHLNQDLFKTVKTPKILGERDTKHTNFKISSYLHLINFHSSIWFSHYRFVLISQLRAQTIGLPALR